MNEKDKEVIAEKIYKKSEENRKRHFAFWVLFLAVFLALAGYGVYLEYRDRTIWAAAVFVILYVYVFGNYIVNLINCYKTGKAATDKLREILDSKSYDIVKFSEIVDFDNLNIKLNNVTALLDTVNGTYYFG